METRTPSDAIAAIADLMTQINRDRDAGMAHAINLLLDVRQIARDALEQFRPGGEREEVIEMFRLAMARIELAVDDLIRAQPGASADEDQALMDAITQPLHEIAEQLPQLEQREKVGGPPIH